jgi:hypothetical protein
MAKSIDKFLDLKKVKYGAEIKTYHSSIADRYSSVVKNPDLGIYMIGESKQETIKAATTAISIHCVMFSLENIDAAIRYSDFNKKSKLTANVYIPAIK